MGIKVKKKRKEISWPELLIFWLDGFVLRFYKKKSCLD